MRGKKLHSILMQVYAHCHCVRLSNTAGLDLVGMEFGLAGMDLNASTECLGDVAVLGT